MQIVDKTELNINIEGLSKKEAEGLIYVIDNFKDAHKDSTLPDDTQLILFGYGLVRFNKIELYNISEKLKGMLLSKREL